jgi:anti-sigma-K factor RskA
MNSKYDQIERYWEGLLEAEELKAFKKKMQEDTDFAEEVNLYKNIEKSIQQRMQNLKEEQKLRATLTNLGKTQKSKIKKSKIIPLMKYKKWLVAASIAIIVGFFMFQNKEVTYASYATHEPMQVSVRGGTNESLERVQKAFNSQDYLLANNHLSRLAEYYRDNAEIQLYYGITLIETDQYDMAKMVLTRIIKGDSLFKYKAQWYLALNSLKQNDKESCKKYLQKIPKEAEEYKEAQSLLSKL